MEQEVEETETYECGLRFNAQPIEEKFKDMADYYNQALLSSRKIGKSYQPGQWSPFGASKQDTQVNFQVPMTKMDWDMKLPVATKDYTLTEEENKAFDSLEGCTPEEIAIAKQVLCKTIQVRDDVTWRVKFTKGDILTSDSGEKWEVE